MINGESPVKIGDTVYYHGSLTRMHGVYEVADVYGDIEPMLDLFPASGATTERPIHVRMISVTRKL